MWSKVKASVDVDSINRAYLNRLLLMLAPEQTRICNQMYPDGIKKRSVDHAILQIERTLTSQNIAMENAADKYDKLKEEIKNVYQRDTSEAESKIKKLEKELELANVMISRLENPISIENAEVQERLDYLNRLEAAGVDNWNGLDHWED